MWPTKIAAGEVVERPASLVKELLENSLDGSIVRHAAEQGIEKLMQRSVLLGFGLIWSGQYFSNIPYSLYTSSEFWTNSAALILIRVGISLLLMAGAYLWTERSRDQDGAGCVAWERIP